MQGKPKEIIDQLATDMPKQFEQAFAQVVKAGMKVLFSDETHELMLDQMEQEGDLGENAGKAIAGLMALMFEKSNGTMPQEVIIPAGTYLLAQGADFIEQVTGEEFTPQIMATANQVMIDEIMKLAGIDTQKFHAAAEQGMARYNAESEQGEAPPPQEAQGGLLAQGAA